MKSYPDVEIADLDRKLKYRAKSPPAVEIRVSERKSEYGARSPPALEIGVFGQKIKKIASFFHTTSSKINKKLDPQPTQKI